MYLKTFTLSKKEWLLFGDTMVELNDIMEVDTFLAFMRIQQRFFNPWGDEHIPIFGPDPVLMYIKHLKLLDALKLNYYLTFDQRTPKQNICAYTHLANFWDEINGYEIDNDAVVTHLPYPFDPNEPDPLRDSAYPVYFLTLLEIYDRYLEMQQHLMENAGIIYRPAAC